MKLRIFELRNGHKIKGSSHTTKPISFSSYEIQHGLAIDQLTVGLIAKLVKQVQHKLHGHGLESRSKPGHFLGLLATTQVSCLTLISKDAALQHFNNQRLVFYSFSV